MKELFHRYVYPASHVFTLCSLIPMLFPPDRKKMGTIGNVKLFTGNNPIILKHQKGRWSLLHLLISIQCGSLAHLNKY